MKSIINKITAALLPLILVFGLAACSDVKTAKREPTTAMTHLYIKMILLEIRIKKKEKVRRKNYKK